MENQAAGAPIDYSPDWYKGLDLVDLLARLIYGENPYESNARTNVDRIAIAWVVWNRKIQSGYGGDTLRAVAENPGAFASITGGKANSNKARNPDIMSAMWSEALNAANLLVNAQNTGTIMLQKLVGINTQTRFLEHTAFFKEGMDGKTDVAIADCGGNYHYLSRLIADYDAWMDGYSGAVNIYYNTI